MSARDPKEKALPTRSDALWNAAAVAGLLLIGLVIGGFLGIVFDRQGFFGEGAEPSRPVAQAPKMPLGVDHDHQEASPDQGGAVRRYEDFDREALEAALQDVADEDVDAGPTAIARSENTVEFLPAIPIPDRGLAGPAPWQAHAVAVAETDGQPMIAIVLDDIGVNRRNARAAIALPSPLTLAFMTYAEDLSAMTKAAREAGHELMLHVPMQPLSPTIDPGPNVLADGLPAVEMTQRLVWGLDRFDGYVGINNHMGSRFTASPEGMALVMGELKARGLLYLDSLTSQSSVAARLAEKAGVPFAERDVFLDNEPGDRAAIDRQLAILEQIALERGYAVGIGHPHPATRAALKDWIPEMQKRGFALVPISAVVRHRQAFAAAPRSDG